MKVNKERLDRFAPLGAWIGTIIGTNIFLAILVTRSYYERDPIHMLSIPLILLPVLTYIGCTCTHGRKYIVFSLPAFVAGLSGILGFSLILFFGFPLFLAVLWFISGIISYLHLPGNPFLGDLFYLVPLYCAGLVAGIFPFYATKVMCQKMQKGEVRLECIKRKLSLKRGRETYIKTSLLSVFVLYTIFLFLPLQEVKDYYRFEAYFFSVTGVQGSIFFGATLAYLYKGIIYYPVSNTRKIATIGLFLISLIPVFLVLAYMSPLLGWNKGSLFFIIMGVTFCLDTFFVGIYALYWSWKEEEEEHTIVVVGILVFGFFSTFVNFLFLLLYILFPPLYAQ